MKDRILLLTLLVFSFTLYSCSDDDNEKEIYPLTFEKDSYEVRESMTTWIDIRSGNKDYTVSVDDKNILTATPVIDSEAIQIQAEKKGETYIHVTDNVSSDRVKLKIKVTDAYIGHGVNNSDHPLFTDNQCLYLVKNENSDFYIFTLNQAQTEFTLATKGNYEFLLENNRPFLILNYEDAEKVKKTHKFDIGNSSNTTITFYYSFFELGWSSDYLKATGPVSYFLNLTEKIDDKDRVASLSLNVNTKIPEGILN